MPSGSSISINWAKIKRRTLTHQRLVRGLLLAFVGLVFLCFISYFLISFFRLGQEVLFGPVNIFSVIFQKPQKLKNDNGRTNILLLGIGDPGHDGPNLSDTMIIASLQTPSVATDQTTTSSPVVDLISVPRDIYLDSLGEKVNTAYAIGQEREPGIGLVLAKATISEITGLPIHYAVRVDFSVFRDIINLVGGLDITVEHSFTDSQYPIDGKENNLCHGDPQFKCRYQTIHFAAGPQHMDGATALVFVRSRHAQGSDGTDFARASRQQLVIEALKTKIFSTDILLNPAKLLTVYNQFKTHIDTDFNPNDTTQLLKLALQFRQAKFKSIVLDLNSNLLVNPPEDQKGWILLPASGNWNQVHKYIQSQLK